MHGKPQLIHLRGTALSSVNLQCAVITSACLTCISEFLRSVQGGQCSELTHLFITEGYVFDRFPRTHSALSVLQLVLGLCVCVSACVFPTSSMMPQIGLIVHVISSCDLLAPPMYSFQKPVCSKVAVRVVL